LISIVVVVYSYGPTVAVGGEAAVVEATIGALLCREQSPFITPCRVDTLRSHRRILCMAAGRFRRL